MALVLDPQRPGVLALSNTQKEGPGRIVQFFVLSFVVIALGMSSVMGQEPQALLYRESGVWPFPSYGPLVATTFAPLAPVTVLEGEPKKPARGIEVPHFYKPLEPTWPSDP